MKIKQDMDKYNLGSNIKKLRKLQHLTQNQTVAKMQILGINISRSTYSQIEMGKKNIRVSELLALCNIFKCSISDFFDGISL